MGGFARGAIRSKAALLPPGTLVLLTAQPPSPTEFGSLAAVEYVGEDSAWLEERLVTGSIPVGALQRIVDWLQ